MLGTAVFIGLILLVPSTSGASCATGQYNDVKGICTQCPYPEAYSTGGVTTACSACAPGTMISGTSCLTCTAGKFSGASASTACQACPLGTGSVANSAACVRCDPAAKLADGATACPYCATACTSCLAGRYNDGSAKKCIACAAGRFSTVIQAVSSSTCSPCPAGQTTLPTTTAATSCIQCNATNMPTPKSANFISATDPLQCAWSCNPGYTRFNYSETGYTVATYTALGYSTTQALAIFHNRNDFCCEPSTVKIGMYMCGTSLPACTPACTRTSDGDSTQCAAVTDAHFTMTDKYKFNRCSDWLCDDFFFLNKTSGGCTAQPVCQAGWTYQRDTTTGAYVSQASGSFTCVACSRCIEGSETLAPCTNINDTVCRICSPAEYSYQAATCIAVVPLGFYPVRTRLTAIPVFQGRPSMFSDGTPVLWNEVDFAQGFFLNTYTQCQPPASIALMFIGGDETCNRLDLNPVTCVLPICKTQCKPWNGIEGWYKLKTGECSKCIYDTTCNSLQYTDMTTCGPTTAPRCTSCPLIPLPNSLGWLNPGRTPFAGPYPCDIVCRDGFTKGVNHSCIPCPSMPSNSKITGGCNWTCSMGFIQESGACTPCPGVPDACSIGYYLGYAVSQCARCLPCTNLVANSVYTSSGQPNGPNTCGIRCVVGTYVSPGYGFDTYNNPVACDQCSTLLCEAGRTYLSPCSDLADADCIQCSKCATGTQTLDVCTPTTNTTCAPCAAALLPDNAAWVGVECTQWGCDAGFIRVPNTTTCLRCRSPRDCIASDSFEDDDGTGCGRCVACDSLLLLPGQCFNGDGQCGVSYLCEAGMPTAAALFFETPPPPVALAAEAVPTPSAILAYASMATLTLDTPALTDELVDSINAQVSQDCACEATVVAVTQDNVTRFCTPSCSVGSRRLLSGGSLVVIDIALLSSTVIAHAPLQPSCGRVVVAWQTYACESIYDQTLVRDRRRLTVHFKRSGMLWEEPMQETPNTWIGVYLVIGIIALIAACGSAVYCARMNEQTSGYMRVKEKDEECEQRYDDANFNVNQSTRNRREMRPPYGGGERW